jgi:hypothetical protein
MKFTVLLITFVGLVCFGLAAEQHITLTVKADGSCVVMTDKTDQRLVAEQQLRSWDHYQKARDNTDDDAKPATAGEVKPFTDEELAKKLREMFQSRGEQSGEDFLEKVETLEIKTNIVRTVSTRTFASLEEMLKQAYAVWGQSGLSFENVKFERDSDDHLRVTLTPSASAQRYAKNFRQQWKLAGVLNELKLVFPGKVLTSGLPHTEGVATWMVIDAQKTETMDAAMKLFDAPTIITSELGGLKLDQPLESKTLQRLARRGSGAPDLPITDAGPGFTAEPLAVTTTTLYYFPNGEKYLEQARAASFARNQTGTVVRTKLFAPKGRTLQSVSDVRVVKATDDKGRAIAGTSGDGDFSETIVHQSGGSQPGNSTQISLRLQLPQPDAQSIDELSAEAIALTAGKWKEMILTNVTDSTTNEVDISNVLEGARMVITKFTAKNRQLNIQARITGPPSIRQIEVQIKFSGKQRSGSSAYERNFATRSGQSTRNLQIQHYGFGEEDGDSGAGPISLVVRYPEDQRRERVRFVLKGLDLL